MSIRGHLSNFSDVRPKLTVVGVGGAGCNAVNNMIASGLVGVEFIVANTDAQALAAASTDLRIQLGAALTEGLGAGSRPEIGEAAAEEAIEDIRNHIKGSHMVFIAAGMGGGTGTGAASVIARVARELGILTVGVVTKPFLFEGARRARIADAGVAELRNFVDTLIVIPNQNLFRIASDKTTFSEAFVMADQVLYSGVACIVDLIIKEGLINLDFADVRTVMTGMGTAMMGTGESSGERRATIAAEEAISNPLLDDVSLRGAKGLLLSITGGSTLTLYEVDEAASRVRQEVDPEANIIVGATYDESLGDRIRVSIVASGMSRAGEAERAPPAPAEDWLRGTKAVATSRAAHMDSVRANVTPPPPPPAARYAPEPPRDPRSGAQDLQQRLTEALQYPQQQGSSFGVPRSASTGHSPSDSRGRGADAWKAPGNVTIEDGPPQLHGAAPPPLPQSYASSYEQGSYAPQPPSEVRRQVRRTPEAAGYPPQPHHGYRQAEPAYGEQMPQHQQHVHGGHQPAPQEPRRRLGLFERIAGRVRGTGDSETGARQSREAYAKDVHGDGSAHADDEGYAHYQHAADPHEAPAQDAELPVFFRERRR
ncbi:MAG TPA: cell division protein FtsZ [Hyphomicrobium sp.]|nr:cell division protein FtsZ [Hyphomicrobium sp.]